MGLQLRIRELFAKDETNTFGTEFGSDDMYLGAVALEQRGTAKHTVQVLPFKALGKIGEFDDGDRKVYTPPRMLFNFGFGKAVFPKDLAITFVLVEKDGGKSMKPFLSDIHQAVKAKADQFLLAGKQDNANGGGDIDWEKVMDTVKKTVKFIHHKWEPDEIFAPQIATFSINSATHRWNGKSTSPEKKIDFKGHGGHYILKYDWHLHFG